MESAEDETGQPEVAGKATPEEDIQRLADELEKAQERELGRIDRELDAVEEADSREAAVAALIRATVGINALGASTPGAVQVETGAVQVETASLSPFGSRSYLVSPKLHVWHPQWEIFGRKRDEQIEKYMRVLDNLVKKYGPDQYQLSIGFPQVISVTLVWSVGK
jgi:hypothetical protein